MKQYKVAAWIGDLLVSRTTMASNDKEAEKMVESSLRFSNPEEDVRIVGASPLNTILKKLDRYE